MIVNRSAENSVEFVIEDGDTDQLARILLNELPVMMSRFARKNKHYGENVFPLGAAGQFPEIDRKVRVLKAQIWDKRGSALDTETTDEVIGDLIGHLVMLAECIEMGLQ
jgi:hypothetical protein